MPVLTAAEVAGICSGELIGDGDASARTVVADSREVTETSAFAAIRGGHDFVAQAAAAGAPFVIVERPVDSKIPAVVVDDMESALGLLATDVRSRLPARVVGITGSTGKTLTKDLLAAALRTRFRVHATTRSFNAEIGVPLVILGCPDDAEVAVIEMGARHRGEIAELCRIARPQAGLITGIGLTHLAEFGSREAIARTKSELLGSLPADGFAVVASDDDFLDLLCSSTSARVITVGPGGHVSYAAHRVDASGRTHGVIRCGGSDVDVVLPVAGRSIMRNAAQATCIADELGVPLDEIARALAAAECNDYRMQIMKAGGRTIVNDAYNANPTSVASALRTVAELAAPLGTGAEMWAVLGEMAELGPVSVAEHERVGRDAAALGFDGVIVVGDPADAIAAGAGAIAHRAATIDDAASMVENLVGPDAFVLVKASRVVGLETLGSRIADQTVRT